MQRATVVAGVDSLAAQALVSREGEDQLAAARRCKIAAAGDGSEASKVLGRLLSVYFVTSLQSVPAFISSMSARHSNLSFNGKDL